MPKRRRYSRSNGNGLSHLAWDAASAAFSPSPGLNHRAFRERCRFWSCDGFSAVTHQKRGWNADGLIPAPCERFNAERLWEVALQPLNRRARESSPRGACEFLPKEYIVFTSPDALEQAAHALAGSTSWGLHTPRKSLYCFSITDADGPRVPSTCASRAVDDRSC
jgi:hypothetical protein